MGGKAGGGWSWEGLGDTFADIGKNSSVATGVGMKYLKDKKGHERDAIRESEMEQKRIEDEIAAQKAAEKKASEEAGLRTWRRLDRASGRRNFSRGTILTSPIGIIGDPQTSGKTLLGQ